ncbi:CidA/LrgA family protein [Roseitranquillus sediminis]|uniref:CidA/LrgA family protein n=1 Tax=Roseitranquillus sediminis TaxID=2809051 RepID=UPI001D0CCF6E|nr:CidA/LrgA family protein [Roseitranquillus sediminis]MBM9593640.1 CidA/LrgA family protein [Roseitranquillus sediminis]
MVAGLAILLSFQLAGEIASRALGLPVPGPVLGLGLLLAALALLPDLAERVAPTARVLLANLSLLFVPAGVGVVGHLDRLGEDGVAIFAAILVSTVLALLVAVGTFLAVRRLVGAEDGESQ